MNIISMEGYGMMGLDWGMVLAGTVTKMVRGHNSQLGAYSRRRIRVR